MSTHYKDREPSGAAGCLAAAALCLVPLALALEGALALARWALGR